MSKSVHNITLLFIVVSGVVFIIGYVMSLNMLRTYIADLTANNNSSEIQAIGSYVDSRLQSVEDIAYSTFWAENKHYAEYYQPDFNFSEDQVFSNLEHILLLHPGICGAAVGLKPGLYPSEGKYGFAPYVTNVSGKMVRMQLGDNNDFSKADWYKYAKAAKDVYWNPIRESSLGRSVSSFCLPLLPENGGDVYGVFALDVNMEALCQECREITSLKRDEVTILDKDLRIISHTDVFGQFTDDVHEGSELWNAMIEKYREGVGSGMVTGKRDGMDYVLYFVRLERTGWLICVESPLEDVYGDANELEVETAAISLLSFLAIALCFLLLYIRMHRALRTEASLEADMKVAEDLQMGMLPKNQPAFSERKDMDIFGLLQPAKMVGGDLYDYLIQDDKLFFCIGDVSGKGVPAAMFMSIVISYFHNKSRRVDSASELVSSLNRILVSHQSKNMFCTFFLGILNLRNGRLDYCNAGHDAPILMRRKSGVYEAVPLEEEHNMVVGALEDIVFKESHTTMRPGDSLFLFTDGVTEAENKNRELFGIEATFDSIKKIYDSHGDLNACEKVAMMQADLHRHTGNCPQSDDITMLLVEYKGTTITLENKIEQLPLLSEFVRNMCGQHGVPAEIIDDLDVAMDEIGANISMYAFPENETHSYYVSFHNEAGELVFTFEDDGVPFDPTQPVDGHLDLPPEERPLGGLGIMMVKELMDKVEYERRDNKNIVCIVKKYEI